MAWPVLQGQELAVLKEAFKSPLQLHAAFDEPSEAAELVGIFFPGISEAGRKQRVEILMAWAAESRVTIKQQQRQAYQGF